MLLEKLIQQLEQFEPTDLPVISLYLNAEADEHGKHNYFTFVRKALPERANTYEANSATRESFDTDIARITKYLENEVTASTQGIAVFACSGSHDFFQAAQVEVPFKANQLFVYDRPHLYPLARLSDRYARYAVLVADTNAARIFVFAAGETTVRKKIEGVKTKRAQIGGWTQMRYQRHTENYHLHHAQEIVEMLERLVDQEHIDRIVLAGNESGIIPILHEQMPERLSHKVIDVLGLPIDTPEKKILQASLDAFLAYDATADAEKVQQLLNEYRADGLAVVGVPDTLAALSNGQVEELIISGSLQSIVYNEEQAQKVLAAYASANSRPASAAEPRMMADELVSRAQRISSAKVSFIEDPALLKDVGGVGALLRYKI